MKNNASIAYALLLIIGDFLALLAAFSVAYILRVKLDPRPLIEQIPARTYFNTFFSILPLWILVQAFLGLYSQNVYTKRFSELARLFIGSFLGILVVIGYDFLTDGKLFPARLIPVYGVLLGFSFLVLFRSAARQIQKFLYAYEIGVSNVVIVGNTNRTMEIIELIKNTDSTGQRIIAVVGKKGSDFTYYSRFADAIKHLKEPIHSIIQTELYNDQLKNDEILRYAQQNHVSYRFVPGNSDLFVGKIAVELFAGSIPMVAVHQTALIGWGRIAKRLFDLSVGLITLLIAIPFMILIAILIAIFDSGPIFLRQKRLTRFNRIFLVYKFRTHKTAFNGLSPEEAFKKMGKPELVKIYRDNGDFLPNDPRVSGIGRFLRKTSLDELPQLFNVLRGDISIVGPRALVPEELADYDKKHTILSVKSGVTGLAQISGRRGISFEERRKLDTYYVQNWSFWLDIIILLRTLRTVVSGAGAE